MTRSKNYVTANKSARFNIKNKWIYSVKKAAEHKTKTFFRNRDGNRYVLLLNKLSRFLYNFSSRVNSNCTGHLYCIE